MNCMKNYLVIIILLISTACSADEMEFIGDNAYSILKKQCEFGARVPGSDAHTECVEYLVNELELYADTVYIQEFKKPVSYNKKGIVFKNIIAVFNSEWNEEIMLCTHYDSRPFSSVKGKPTPGANDGASGTAVLIEIARIINSKIPSKKIKMVFFDGEDGGRINHLDEWFIGSKYYAKNHKGKKPDICILIDMIGDKDLHIYKEGFSQMYNANLNDHVFNIAYKMNKTVFINEIGYFVQDDHIPLNNAGIKCINLIDMHYEYWHTPEDTPDKCSAKSLKDVGDVLLEIIYE